MKKIEIKGKLSLNKSTIANLSNQQMNTVKGGGINGNSPDAILWTLVFCKTKPSKCACEPDGGPQ